MWAHVHPHKFDSYSIHTIKSFSCQLEVDLLKFCDSHFDSTLTTFAIPHRGWPSVTGKCSNVLVWMFANLLHLSIGQRLHTAGLRNCLNLKAYASLNTQTVPGSSLSVSSLNQWSGNHYAHYFCYWWLSLASQISYHLFVSSHWLLWPHWSVFYPFSFYRWMFQDSHW